VGAACWFGGYAEFLDHRHMPSGERPSQPWRMISRRMGTFAEMVLAVAHENEGIVPASVSAILCGNVEHPWENSSQHERRNT
jgi:hypothetical protein